MYSGPDRIVIGSEQWRDMDRPTIDQTVARVREGLEQGEPVYLVLHGGEPLLVPNAWM
jgi:sulfatase maturation enzyme AslB (radical SAM superfamily)